MRNVAIDLETSHLTPEGGVIIQITCLEYDKRYKTVNTFDTYIRPYPEHFNLIKKCMRTENDLLSDDQKIIKKAMEINQIDLEVLEKHPTVMEVRNKFITWWQEELGGEKIFPLGQNFVGFDKRFLENFVGKPNIDKYFHYKARETDKLLIGMQDAGFFPDLEKTSLSKACEYFEIEYKHHDSYSDTWATIQLWRTLIKKMKAGV